MHCHLIHTDKGRSSEKRPSNVRSTLATPIASYNFPLTRLLMPAVESVTHTNPVSKMLFVPNHNSSMLIPTAVATTLRDPSDINKYLASSTAITSEQLPPVAPAESNVSVSSSQLPAAVSSKVRDGVGVSVKQTNCTKQNGDDSSLEATPPPKCSSVYEHSLPRIEKNVANYSVSCPSKGILFYKKEVIQALVRNIHSQNQNRVCPLCKASYWFGWALSLHLMTIHLSRETGIMRRDIQCPHCHCCFSLNDQFTEHMRRFHPKSYCYQCPYVSTELKLLFDHTLSTHFNDLVRNNKKQMVFVTARQIRMKLQAPQQANNPRQCPFCPFKSKHVYYRFPLKLHLFNFHLACERSSKGKIKCCYCLLEFQCDILYRMHIKMKHCKDGYQYCPFCPCKATKLTSHFRKVHGSSIVLPRWLTSEPPSKNINLANSMEIRSSSVIQQSSVDKQPFVLAKSRSKEPMLDWGFNPDKSEIRGKVSTLSLVNSLELHNVPLINISQNTSPRTIPLRTCHSRPNCSEVFTREKELKVHLIAKRESCSSVYFNSLEGGIQEKHSDVGDCGSLLVHRENNTLLGYTDVAERVKAVGKCSCQDGNGKDYHAPSKRCCTLKINSFDLSECDYGDLTEYTMKGKEMSHTKKTEQNEIFLNHEDIESFVFRMTKSYFRDPCQQQQLKCPFCTTKESFQFQWNLFLHITTEHLSYKPNGQRLEEKCPHCNECFLLKEQFLLHMNSAHQFDDKKCCPQCPFVSQSLRGLFDHTVSTHFEKLMNVDIERVFVSAEQIKEKLQMCQRLILDRQCPFCAFNVSKRPYYQRFLQLHLLVYHLASERTAEGTIKCCHCSQHFHSDIQYRGHVRNMHQEKGFQYCPFCPCKAQHLGSHLIEAHGSTIVMPEYTRPLPMNKICHNDDTRSKEITESSVSPLEQTNHKSEYFCSYRDCKLSDELGDSYEAGMPSFSNCHQDKRPQKHRKTCHDSLISHRALPLHNPTNHHSHKVLAVTDPSGSSTSPSLPGLFCDQYLSDPQEQVFTAKSILKTADAVVCSYCKQSFSVENMYEHFLTKHNLDDGCQQCSTKFTSEDELFEHTELLHFKLPAKILPINKTIYHPLKALRQILKKALLDLSQNSSRTTLNQCPLCSFVCKGILELRKILSHHLLLCHMASERTPRNNIQCPHCNTSFNFDSAFRHHLKFDHNSSQTFHCPFCPFKCAAHRALLLHNITVIHGARLFPEICLDVNQLARRDVRSTRTDEKIQKLLEWRRSILHVSRVSSFPKCYPGKTSLPYSSNVNPRQDRVGIFGDNEKIIPGHSKYSIGELYSFHNKRVSTARVIELADKCPPVTGRRPRKTCPFCKENFQLRRDMLLHMMTGHLSQQKDRNSLGIKCPHCDDRFLLDGQFRMHLSDHHFESDKKFCQHCPFVTLNLKHFSDHILASHFKELLFLGKNLCVFFGAETICKELKIAHSENNDGQCPFCLFKCQNSTTCETELRLHLVKSHLACDQTNQGDIKCCYCFSLFADDTSYREHLRVTHETKEFELCPFCPLQVPHELMTTHLLNVHGSNILVPSMGDLTVVNDCVHSKSLSSDGISFNSHREEEKTSIIGTGCTSAKNSAVLLAAPMTEGDSRASASIEADSTGATFPGSTDVLFPLEQTADKSRVQGNHLNCPGVNYHQLADITQINSVLNISEMTIQPEENYFVCPRCCKQFSMANELMVHLKLNDVARRLPDLLPVARCSHNELEQMIYDRSCLTLLRSKTDPGERGKQNEICGNEGGDGSVCHVSVQKCSIGSDHSIKISSNLAEISDGSNQLYVTTRSPHEPQNFKDTLITYCKDTESQMQTVAPTKHEAVALDQRSHLLGETSVWDSCTSSELFDKRPFKRRKISSSDLLSGLSSDTGDRRSCASELSTMDDAPVTSGHSERLHSGAHVEESSARGCRMSCNENFYLTLDQSENENMIFKVEFDSPLYPLVDVPVLGCPTIDCSIKSESLCAVGDNSIKEENIVVKSELECSFEEGCFRYV